MLAKKGIKSIGIDISDKVILKAKRKIKRLGLDNYISLYVADGLYNIDENVDTLVLAGMGAYTISDIISKSNKKYKKIITISNTNNDYLRNKMHSYGYYISCEKIIYDSGKYYNLIFFKNGIRNYTEKELMIGTNVVKDDIYYKWLDYIIEKYKKIQLDSNFTNEKINLMVMYLQDEK